MVHTRTWSYRKHWRHWSAVNPCFLVICFDTKYKYMPQVNSPVIYCVGPFIVLILSSHSSRQLQCRQTTQQNDCNHSAGPPSFTDLFFRPWLLTSSWRNSVGLTFPKPTWTESLKHPHKWNHFRDYEYKRAFFRRKKMSVSEEKPDRKYSKFNYRSLMRHVYGLFICVFVLQHRTSCSRQFCFIVKYLVVFDVGKCWWWMVKSARRLLL